MALRNGRLPVVHQQFATVRLLTGVNTQMLLYVRIPLETFAANLATKWPFVRVNTNMGLEAGVQSEPLLADFAFKRPLAGVD